MSPTTTATLNTVNDLVGDAAALARYHLDTPDLADRWRHVQTVARRAAELTPTVNPADDDLVVAAAWLHDLGYADTIVVTGMHAIDGARYLMNRGLPLRLAALVAHHSGARFEAAERGLAHQMQDFPYEAGPVADALATADLTTGPQGQPMTFETRMDEILQRYPTDSPVHRAMKRGRPELAAQVQRTLDRLTRATGTSHSP
jgi:putative nucleotidyltransferase with HDIG domain